MLEVRFMSLTGKFVEVRKEKFATRPDALAAVKTYAEANGFTNVKLVDDFEDDYSSRFTATTPGGRGGRNVAFMEPDFGDE